MITEEDIREFIEDVSDVFGSNTTTDEAVSLVWTWLAHVWDEGVKAAVDADCLNPPCGCCDGCDTILVNPYETK